MFSLFAKKGPTTATINGQAIPVEPKETLLQAALRAGIDFPSQLPRGRLCRLQMPTGRRPGQGTDRNRLPAHG